MSYGLLGNYGKDVYHIWLVALTTPLVSLVCLGIVAYAYGGNSLPSVNELQSITSRLGNFVELPAEQPTIVTILSQQKLSNVVLAAKAKDGDKLIIYPVAKRIILYRPSTQKVVEMLGIVEQVDATR
jgi:hypothetical protein